MCSLFILWGCVCLLAKVRDYWLTLRRRDAPQFYSYFLGQGSALWCLIPREWAGISLIALQRKGMQSQIPYGPYIALAAVSWMLGGYHLWEAYVALMGF